MHGNVWEWCLDHYSVPGASTVVDPIGPASGSTYIARGGSWGSWGLYCRAAFRPQLAPSVKTRYFGFRVVLAQVNSATPMQSLAPSVSKPSQEPAASRPATRQSPAALPVEDVSANDPAGFDPVVILGQSNAVGGTDMSNPESSDPSVWMFGFDYRFKVAYEPVFDCTGQLDSVNSSHFVPTSPYGHSWSLRAAKGVTASIHNKIILVPCAASSTSIQNWMPGPDRFDRTTLYGAANCRRFIAARNGVKAIWFYGYESNTNPPYLETYYEDWKRLISEFWSDWGQVPIIYVQLARCADPCGFGMVDWMWAGADIQRQIETGSGSDKSMPLHFLVPAFDLPMQDVIHLNREADDILADRIARATRQHVYGDTINGTGPRLVSLTHPLGDKTSIRIALTRPINAAVNRYDNLFHAYVRGKELPIEDVQRDTDESAILITLTHTVDGPVTISYGGNRADRINTGLPNVVKDADGLPLPQFFCRPVFSSLVGEGLEGLVEGLVSPD
jgi:hypothetical protein